MSEGHRTDFDRSSGTVSGGNGARFDKGKANSIGQPRPRDRTKAELHLSVHGASTGFATEVFVRQCDWSKAIKIPWALREGNIRDPGVGQMTGCDGEQGSWTCTCLDVSNLNPDASRDLLNGMAARWAETPLNRHCVILRTGLESAEIWWLLRAHPTGELALRYLEHQLFNLLEPRRKTDLANSPSPLPLGSPATGVHGSAACETAEATCRSHVAPAPALADRIRLGTGMIQSPVWEKGVSPLPRLYDLVISTISEFFPNWTIKSRDRMPCHHHSTHRHPNEPPWASDPAPNCTCRSVSGEASLLTRTFQMVKNRQCHDLDLQLNWLPVSLKHFGNPLARRTIRAAPKGLTIRMLVTSTECEVIWLGPVFHHSLLQTMAYAFRKGLKGLRRQPSGKSQVREWVRARAIGRTALAKKHLSPKCFQLDTTFRQQVARHPNRAILFHRGSWLTYHALDQRVEAMARWLAKHCIRPEEPVVILLEHQPELVAAMLAIHRAGGAILAIDAHQPRSRISALIEDCQARFCITKGKLPFRHTHLNLRILDVDQPIPPSPPCHFQGVTDANQLAYLMYTSGSTGKPKAVMGTFLGLARRLGFFWNQWPFAKDDVSCLKKSVSLIGAIPEVFAPILAGTPIHIADAKASIDPGALLAFLETHRVTRLWGSPSLLQALLDCMPETGNHLETLRLVVSSGEALAEPTAKRWLERVSGARLFNVYGATELASDISLCEVKRPERDAAAIGRPLPQNRFAVVDRRGRLVAKARPGRLWIGGDHLARGYWQDPGATARAFRPDPFASQPGARIFDSGDSVVMTCHGNLHFKGRVDHQLNIRGYRMEPAEIERELLHFPGVRNAGVTVWEQGTFQKLVAFIVPQPHQQPRLADIRTALAQHLPNYMVPNQFLFVPKLPKTRSGKLDRNALKRLPTDMGRMPAALQAPRNATERQLAQLWSEVLGLQKIGVHQNFIELGGHSLHATKLLSLIRKRMGHHLPMVFFFQNRTISQQAGVLDALQDPGSKKLVTQPCQPLDWAPLTPEQHSIWLQHQLAPFSTHLHLQQAWLFSEIAPDRVIHALARLQNQNANLRMVFSTAQEAPNFSILPFATPSITIIDHRHATPSQATFRTWQTSAASQPFHLNSPPFRCHLYLMPRGKLLLSCGFHHLIKDGWSLQIFTRQLQAAIQASNGAIGSAPSGDDTSLTTYAQWRNAPRTRAQLDALRTYWQRQLSGLPGLQIHPDFPPTGSVDFRGNEIRLRIPKNLQRLLKAWPKKHGHSLHVLSLAVFAYLLSKRCAQNDIAILTPFANRGAFSEATCGMFVQTLILRMAVKPQLSVKDWVARVDRRFADAASHHGLGFEDLLHASNLQGNVNGHPALKVMFDFQRDHQPGSCPDNRPSMETLHPKYRTSQFNLTLNFIDRAGDLEIRLQYQTAVFKPASVLRFGRQYLALLQAGTAQPETCLEKLNGLPKEELRRWFSPLQYPEPAFEPIHRRILAIAARWPDRAAVVSGARTITYDALVQSAYHIGARILQAGLKPGDYLPIFADACHSFPATWLACMMTGVIGLPTRTNLPTARLKRFHQKPFSQLGIWASAHPIPKNLSIRMLVPEAPAGRVEPLKKLELSQNWPVFAMFTSGTTGEPKIVEVPHLGMSNRFDWMDHTFPTEPSPTVLQTTAPQFDSSFWEIFWPLTHGGRTVLSSPPQNLQGRWIARQIRNHQITILDSVPSVFRELLHDLPKTSEKPYQSLRTLILGSEDFPLPLAKQTIRALPASHLWNLYGPTEASIGCVAHRLDGTERIQVPIGVAISGAQALVLDRNGNPVPVGMPGQLFLAGNCLATGYPGMARATASVFLPHPDSSRHGDRVYRTGDLVRRLPSGQLIFCGRIDDQFQLHGIRIEPGEIEAFLARHPRIEACAVTCLDVGDHPRLTAYTVCQGADHPEPDELKAFLGQFLPRAIIPTRFIGVEQLPKNAAGKLDRKALAAQPHVENTLPRLAMPEHKLEAQLIGIFEEVLNQKPIGLFDSFFALGGHSLSAIRLLSRIRAKLSLDPPLRLLFEKPTPASLAKALKFSPTGDLPPLKRLEHRGSHSLSFAQMRLWFLIQLNPKAGHCYNIRLIKKLKNVCSPSLERAMSAIVRRHQLWRCTVPNEAGRPYLKPLPVDGTDLPIIDLSGLTPKRMRDTARDLAAKETSKAFRIDEDILHRYLLLRLANDENLLVFTCHHLIGDGWSMALWEGEIEAHYRVALGVSKTGPAPLSHQFTDLADWQIQRFEKGLFDKDMGYWRARLQDLEPTELAPMPARVEAGAGDAHEAILKLTGESFQQTIRLAEACRVTPFVWMLTLLKVLVHRYTGQRRVCIGTPVAGRELPESEALLGCFLNTLPLATDLGGNPTFPEAIKRVRESFLGGIAHQDVPFEKLVEELWLERDLDHSPFFQILLVWEHAQTASNSSVLFANTSPQWCRPAPRSKYDLTVEICQEPTGFDIAFRFAAHRYEKSLANAFADEFLTLANRVHRSPGNRILHLPLTREKPLCIPPLPKAPADSLPNLLTTRFDMRVRFQPDAIAIASPDANLTYAVVDQLANRLAFHLAQHQFEPETVIAFCQHPSPLTTITMLGILRAGHAFLAIDPGLPHRRRQFMLKNSQAKLLILSQETKQVAFDHSGPRLYLNLDHLPETPSAEALPKLLKSQLAYLVYTSGSTGHPKGIAVSHEAIVDYLLASNARYKIQPRDRILQMAGLSFDACMRDIFGTLLAGATMITPSSTEFGNPIPLCRRMRAHRVTVIYSGVPTYLTLLAKEANLQGQMPNLRLLVSGGERLAWRTVALFKASFGNQVQVFNQYGLSETTVTVTSFHAVPKLQTHQETPLGRPLSYAGIYLFGHHLAELPESASGEIYIAGSGHARGYWRRPALTAQHFLPDPISKLPGARMFRTGDLARLSSDVSQGLQFIGRRDHQVKIRGQRVELGEIEACLGQHGAVAACAVRWWEKPEPRLVAYLKLSRDQANDSMIWRKHLENRLPAVMVPQDFVILKALPRLRNHKIDYHRLPQPEARAPREVAHAGFEAQPTLTLLGQIWKSLLNVESVGADDHFFNLGGHSLIATQVLARIRHWFGLDLPLRLIFQKQTLRALAEAVDEARIGHVPHAEAPVPGCGDDPPRLSSAQKRIWFLEQLEPGSSRFNMPRAYQISGIDSGQLSAALKAQANQHLALRTRMVSNGSEPIPELLPADRFQPTHIDLRGLRPDIATKVKAHLTALEARTLFQVQGGPLCRNRVLILRDRQFLLLQTLHHLVGDAWSLRILEQDLHQRLVQPAPQTTPSQLTYFDWTSWQERQLQGVRLKRLLQFWTEQMEGVEPLKLSIHRNEFKPSKGRGSRFGFNIPPQILKAIRALCQPLGCTVFMALQATFQTLLYRYSGQTKFGLGVPIANRNYLETEHLVGLLMNTVPLRSQIEGNPSFKTLLDRVRLHALDAFSHSEIPFEKLVQELDLPRKTHQTPLFQVMMVFHPDPVPTQKTGPNEPRITRLQHKPTTAKYDLSAHFNHFGNGLRANFVFDQDRFAETHIRQMAQHFLRILNWVSKHPDKRLSKLPLLSPLGYRNLKALNQSREPLPKGNLAEKFHRTALATPDAVALYFQNRAWSFACLSKAVAMFQETFRANGIQPGDRIGNGWPRSPQTIAAMLATFKIGAIHVPLDIGWPKNQLRQVLEDTAPKLILAPPEWDPPEGIQAALLFQNDLPPNPPCSVLDPPRAFPPDTPAYLLFTSGTSGRPKGVLGNHGALLNRLESLWRSHPYQEGEVELAKKSPVFIGTFTEVLGPLLRGQPIALMPRSEDRNPNAILHTIEKHRISRLWAFPSLLRFLLPTLGEANANLRHLKWLFSSGEPLAPELIQELRVHLPNTRIINIYGSTELASDVAWQETTLYLGSKVPVGRAMTHCQFWVKDRYGAHQPFGLPGELLVGGLNLAQCYWNRPAMTADRFRPDDLSGKSGARLFHTGDLAKMNEAGQVTLLGRCDAQLKIRGYRIETEGVLRALRSHPHIEDCALSSIQRNTLQPELVAYIQSHRQLSPSAIRQHLVDRVPDHALPSRFVFLGEIPRTQHGKLLKNALPGPTYDRHNRYRIYEAPRNYLEAILSDIWSHVLGVAEVGIHDNFFELGGHSLLATQVRARIAKQLNRELPLSKIFQYQTLAELAGQLTSSTTPICPPITHTDRPGPLPLSIAQRRWWLLDQLDPGPQNQIFRAYRIQNLRLDWLATAIGHIASRHSPLRTRFSQRNGSLRAKLVPPNSPFLTVIDLSDLPDAPTSTRRLLEIERQRRFNLAQQPGFRAIALIDGSSETTLAFHFHHIAIDAWGLSRFRQELACLYRSQAGQRPVHLPELAVNYSDYARWQRRWLRRDVEKQLLGFWKPKLLGTPNLALQTDMRRPEVQRHRGSSIPIRLSKTLTQNLVQMGRNHHATPSMVLLAAYRALLQRWSDQTDFCIGTPVAQRQRPELEPLIGVFVNTLAIRIQTSKNPTFLELLEVVRQEALNAYDHQDLPFERLVSALDLPRDASRHPLFQAMFVHFNHPEPPAGQRAAAQQLFGNPLERSNISNLFDITLYLGFDRGALRGRLSYDSDLFHGGTAARFVRQFTRVLRQVSVEPERRLGDLELFTKRNETLLRRLWGRDGFPDRKETILDRIREQAEAAPDRIAIADGRKHFSRQFLEKLTDRVAAALQRARIVPGSRVVVCMARSVERAVAQLGVLKAGAAFIPIHPDHPIPRIRRCLDLAQPDLVLCDKAQIHRFSPAAFPILPFPDTLKPNPAQSFTKPILHPLSAAYMIFTSGTSGDPKLTVNHHAGILNRIHQTKTVVATKPADVILHKTPFEFDVAVWELFWPLCAGTRLEIAGSAVFPKPQDLVRLIRTRRVSWIHFVPSTLAAVLDILKAGDTTSLRGIFTSGETLTPELCKDVQGRTHLTVHNLYGPTEAAVEVSHHRLDPEQPDTPTIGRPLPGNRCYLLDANLRPVQPGQPGEIYLGGCQVARGYRNQQRLTAELFLPDPFTKRAGSRMYRSGDLGRFSPNGNLQFLGRRDHQIKLRGVRLELGAIECELRNFPPIRDALVLAKGSGEKTTLTAYVLLKPGGPPIGEADIRDHLTTQLPGYMIPNRVLILKRWPKTASGKVNRKALPSPHDQPSQYLPPTTRSQKVLTEFWKSLLGQRTFNLDDDFFRAGGNSIQVIRLATKMSRHLQATLPISLLFKATTIRQQAKLLEQNPPSHSPAHVFKTGPGPGTFVLVHAGFEPCRQYGHLADVLGKRRSVIGLHLNENLLPNSVEVMAKSLIQTLEDSSLKPPFHLIGWSLGGVLAFEMAQQMGLKQQVASLTLIDSRRYDLLDDAGRKRILNQLHGNVAGERPTQNIPTVEGEEPAGTLPPDPALQRHRQALETIAKAGFAYRPRTIDVPVGLVHAKGKRRYNAWSPLCIGPLVEQQSQGGHFDLLKPPFVDEIGKNLVLRLIEVDPETVDG